MYNVYTWSKVPPSDHKLLQNIFTYIDHLYPKWPVYIMEISINTYGLFWRDLNLAFLSSGVSVSLLNLSLSLLFPNSIFGAGHITLDCQTTRGQTCWTNSVFVMCKLSDMRHCGAFRVLSKSNTRHQTRNARTTITCTCSVGLSGYATLVTRHSTLVKTG